MLWVTELNNLGENSGGPLTVPKLIYAPDYSFVKWD